MLREFCVMFPTIRARFISAACCTLAGLVIPLRSLPACAAVEVQGTSASVHVVAQNATVSEVLKALTEKLKSFHCKETINLDGVISGNYTGSVEDILGRVLREYDYIITIQGTAVEIVVIGKSGSAVVPASGTGAPVAAAPTSVAVTHVPPAFVAPLPIGSGIPARDR
jgi:hypothetical protein